MKKVSKIKTLFVSTILFLSNFLNAQEFKTNLDQKNENLIIEQSFYEEAEYPGGFDSLNKFIAENYHMPDTFRLTGIDGKVYVQFAVNVDGTVSEVKIKKSTIPSCPECDAEAIRVVSLLKGWIPGNVNDSAVKFYYNIPINLSFDSENVKTKDDEITNASVINGAQNTNNFNLSATTESLSNSRQQKDDSENTKDQFTDLEKSPESLDNFSNDNYKLPKNKLNKLARKFLNGRSFYDVELNYQNIESYFSTINTRFLNISIYVDEADYLVTKLENLKDLSIAHRQFIERFKDTLNQRFIYFTKQSFNQSKYNISELSEKWMVIKKYNSIDWLVEPSQLYVYEDVLINPIQKYYFDKLMSSQSPIDQDEIVRDFSSKFPGINEVPGSPSEKKCHPLDYIIGNDEDWCTGQITIYNHSYINYHSSYAGENSLMSEIPYWISVSGIPVDIKTGVNKEIVHLFQGKITEKVEVYKDSLLFYQIFFPENDMYSHPELINIYKEGIKEREIHFVFPDISSRQHSSYTFYFEGDDNITLNGKNDTISLANKWLRENNFDAALSLINKARNNDFPDTLEINKLLDEVNENIILSRNDYEDSLIKISVPKIDSLLFKNEFDMAKEIIREAQNNHLPEYHDTNVLLSQKLNEVEKKEKEFKILTEQNRLNEVLSLGQKYINSKKYKEAITLFQDELSKNKKLKDREIKGLNDDKSKLFETNDIKPQLDSLKIKLDLALSLQKAEEDRIVAEANRIKNLEFEKKMNFTKVGKVEISKNYLKLITFTNGDSLDFAATAEEFVEKTLDQKPVYCYYNFDSKFSEKGYYYNLFAFNDIHGRKLFSDEYRLPFQSEIEYMAEVIKQIESKKAYGNRLTLKDYIFSSNSDKSYNGYNFVSYERNTFNGSVTNEQLKKGYAGYGQSGFLDELEDLKHIFWTLSDFEENDVNSITYSDMLKTNYLGQDYSSISREILTNPINYGLCELNREVEDSYGDYDILISSDLDIEKIIPRWGHKGDYELIASQIKLVKQRNEINSSDWLPNSTSRKLKYKHVIDKYGTNKKEYTTIQFAHNLDEWLDYCNNNIPACMSFRFDSKNDKTHGLLYNGSVFSLMSGIGMNFPVEENSKMIDLIDISNLRYSYNGSAEQFYNSIMDDQGLNNSAYCSYDDVNKEIIFYDNLNPYTFNYRAYPKSSFFPVIPSKRDYSSDPYFTLTNFSSYYYEGQFELNLSFNNIYNSYDYSNSKYEGYSIRFLKND